MKAVFYILVIMDVLCLFTKKSKYKKMTVQLVECPFFAIVSFKITIVCSHHVSEKQKILLLI